MFRLHHTDRIGTPAAVIIPAAAGVEYAADLALTATGAVASGTTKPEYICGEKKTGAAGEGVLAYKILPGDVYETTLSAAGTALKVGDKVTLSADGKQVTATTTSGVAELVEIRDPAAGGVVLVRF